MKYRRVFELVLQIIISVLIGMEVSIEPNPYIQYLILALVVYILIKNNKRIEKVVDRYL
jgi:hypothetical protein